VGCILKSEDIELLLPILLAKICPLLSSHIWHKERVPFVVSLLDY
jgi:hypothetical protein